MAKVFGIPVLEYDGVAEVWVDSLEDWMSVVTSPQFLKEVARKLRSAPVLNVH
jgi:hypothetical protein